MKTCFYLKILIIRSQYDIPGQSKQQAYSHCALFTFARVYYFSITLVSVSESSIFKFPSVDMPATLKLKIGIFDRNHALILLHWSSFSTQKILNYPLLRKRQLTSWGTDFARLQFAFDEKLYLK
jgi:hypothetical protein